MTSRWRGSYLLAVLTALLALGPYVASATAFAAVAERVGSDLGASPVAVELAGGLGNAAYAVGLVGAAQLGLRFAQRRLFLLYAPVLVAGSVVATAATGPWVFGLGRVLEGAGAGAVTISVLPVLITRFPTTRLPLSATAISLGLFGASACGPLVGGLLAASVSWRWLFAAVALLSALAWLLGALAVPRFDPPDPDRPVDRPALLLVLLTATGTFVGTSLLTGHPFASGWVLAPLVVGLVALVALVVVSDHEEDALVPVRTLTTQLPVSGGIAVMVGGAVFVAALQLTQTFLADVAQLPPDRVGHLFWSAPIGALLAAASCGLLFRTRWLPVLVDLGLAALVVGVVLLLLLPGGTSPTLVVPVSAALLGFGAGATTSPGLFLIGFGLPIGRLGRAFAMVQLLRSLATYAVAPVVVHVAESSSDVATGTRTGLVVLLVVAAVGLVAALGVPLASGARLRTPDLDGWLDGGRALPSPRTGEAVSGGRPARR